MPGLRYTLRTGIAEGRMVFIGVGGSVDGQVNPLLSAAEGQVVQVTLINGEGAEHDIVFDTHGPAGSSAHIVGPGASTSIAFAAGRAGDYAYYCSVPGHRLSGMEGKFLVTPQPPSETVVQADISQKPEDVPPPIGNRGPQTVRVDLVTVELEARLAEGTTFGYWTFNGRVPGPMLRVRVGDTVEVHLKNAEGSSMLHSVDFHAATGPGGGAASTQTNPGEEKSFRFKALTPGLFVYHCATPMVAHHIANGMYGMILVEPEGGLPPVDREYYVMQGEIYTDGAFGQHGSQEFNVEKLLNERPEYFVFNGSVGALSNLPSDAGEGGRDCAHLFRCRRSKLYLIVPCHRRDIRQGLQSWRRDERAAEGHPDSDGPCRRRGHHRVQGRCARQLYPRRSRAGEGGAGTCWHAARRRAAKCGNFRRQGRAWNGALKVRADGDGNGRFWPILLQKSFWGGERKFLEPLMRFTRGDVRDHIVSSKIDHGPP